MIKLIDTHAHLDHIDNLEAVLDESAGVGVKGVLTVSTDLTAMKKNLDIKLQYESSLKDRWENRASAQHVSPAHGVTGSPVDIYLGLGVHPGDIKAGELEESYTFIEQHIREADVIGEIGLDFSYKWIRKDDAKKNEQREVFRRQLAIAKKFDKPVVVHTRWTWKECLAIVKEFEIKKANFHWYSGPADVLEEIIKNGYYVSAGPALAFSPQSREAIRQAPIEQILIETDSPVYFNYPEEMGGGFKATPKDVFKSLHAFAVLQNFAPEEAARILNKNAHDFIGIGLQNKVKGTV